MKIKILFALILLSGAFYNNANAQNKFIDKYSLSAWFGFREINRDSLPDTEDLDFLNYLDNNSETAEYEYLGFTTHIWFNNRWETDIKIAMYSDFAPTYLNVKGIFTPFKHMGFTMGIHIYPHYLNYFDTFHKLQNDGFYGDTDSNQRQRMLSETGFMAGLFFPFSYRSFSCSLYLNGGVSSMEEFREVFDQKEINSNLRKMLIYETHSSPAFYFLPEAELKLDILKLGKVTGGIQLQANWYVVNRRINYTRTTYEWTETDPLTEKIENPVHHFDKYDVDFGLYFVW